MQIKRAYKYRSYPTPAQEVILARTFGSARFVYNHMLHLRTKAWENDQTRISYGQTSAELTRLKRNPDFSWLNEVSSVPVQQSLRHLQTAFQNFFAKRSGYPGFHSRRGVQSATYVATAFDFDGKHCLRLGRMADPLAIRWSRTIPKAARVTTVTVSRDCAGRYFASLLCDDNVEALPEVTGAIGIDMGLTDFLITSAGEKVSPPQYFRKSEKKLKKLQRSASRKLEAAKIKAGIPKGSAIPKGTRIARSQNFRKDQKKIARLHAHVADSRRDFQHKLSTRLIRENQTISVETLAVKNMSKTAKGTVEKPGTRVRQKSGLNRAILDASWSEFIRMLEYKSNWYGRTFIKLDRWFPSSKKCGDCGFTMKCLPLSVREWTCPDCGVIHDRDINAACNILAAGLAVSALGESLPAPNQA
jgi:putative transposase